MSIPPQWFFWALLAVLSWGFWAALSKIIGSGLTAAQSQAVSTLGILPVMLVLALIRSGKSPVNRRRGNLVGFGAGVLVCLGNLAYYHALNLGGKAATVVSVTAVYPLVTVLLATLLLKERMHGVQILGSALSLGSIVLFNISSVEGWASGWLAFAMIPIVLWGVGGLLQKVSTNYISGERSAFWFLVAFVPVALVLLVMEPIRQRVPLMYWLLAVALGFLFSLGNLALLLAFAKNGKAAIIAPLAGLYPLVSIPIAITFMGEKISIREWVGIGLALAAVIALAWEGKKTERTVT